MPIKKLFPGVYSVDGKLATANLARGRRVYNEKLETIDGVEYRLWNPYRSKLAAAILNGLKNFQVKDGASVLYLGAATGTTASHVSDIIGRDGKLYAVELSERNMRNLLNVCETRPNMLPILADARYTEKYKELIGKCNVIYQDVSAREQAGILLKNTEFLESKGLAYFIIKSQSIDISKKPKEIYEGELKLLKNDFEVIERIGLEPYDTMHLFAVLKKL